MGFIFQLSLRYYNTESESIGEDLLMPSNLKREFCSRLLLLMSASFVPALIGVSLIRYPNANIFDPKLILSCWTIIIFSALLRLAGLHYQDKIRGRGEILWASLFETVGYALASIAVTLAVVPTSYPEVLEAILSEKLWTQKIYLFYVICFLFICLGVLFTLFPYKKPNVHHYIRRRKH